MANRRNFIRTSTLSLAATTLHPLIDKGARVINYAPGSNDLSIGIADYTFVHFDITQSIQMMQRIGIHYMSIKDFHLPLDSSQEKIDAIIKQYKDGDISVYAVGVIYMKTRDAVDRAFDYAKKVGVPLIIGVPDYDLIDYTEQQVKAYDIRLAIHNHGPEDKLYSSPEEAYKRIKTRDSRMGLCLDIGHAMRAGVDPSQAVLHYGSRIFDLHIKDVTKAQKDGEAIEAGRGIINFRALIKALRKINYTGHCSIEFEKDMKDPLPGIAESVGFFRGVNDGSV
ncbi:sugar phosphate isomerase/epimerase [Ginsengibacter hankyongi]|uniref:Sugar phosphate isomerase/epimerase n=1 Tax=Ginsengibacter hankyongi TaxID=2607284 RepID=A0A5J5IDD9_9BACT|nr:sugar phosphate isomerase/epimerase [Ginsengibacter hankyongi]KAA9036280.1 sugar phosphate isomerase/epimerase [Ginsengibacter hankyongi]